MHVEAETTVDRPRSEVFEYIARAERLPEYVAEFDWVRQSSPGEPAQGTEDSYKMTRGRAEGTFRWTEFTPTSKLAWHGPPVKGDRARWSPRAGGSSRTRGAGTRDDRRALATRVERVKLVMRPIPGGLYKLMAPLLSMGMRRGNAKALERLEARLEGGDQPRLTRQGCAGSASSSPGALRGGVTCEAVPVKTGG